MNINSQDDLECWLFVLLMTTVFKTEHVRGSEVSGVKDQCKKGDF